MNLATIENSWQEIADITAKMDQLAANEDWIQISELAANRHRSITEHFLQYPVGPDTADFYSLHLGRFMSKEEKLQKLARNARREAMKRGLKINDHRKAAKAYNNTK